VLQVRRLTMQEGDEFLLLACDGIWDVLTNQQVRLFVPPAALRLFVPPDALAAAITKAADAILHACIGAITVKQS
jgi:serine/threonine protein phosphatase PrpC